MPILTNIPNDPVMLLSVINTNLRDHYTSLDTLCADMNIKIDTIIEKLRAIDYEYDVTLNQFV